MNKKQIQIIIVVLTALFLIKISTLPSDIEKIQEHSESDLSHYIKIAGWIMGTQSPTNEQSRTYQYPPLYPLFIIPALYLDTITYILTLNIILSILCFFPIYLISRRYTGFYQSLFISSLIIIFNMIFSIKSYGYPMILSALLFSWFIYFFKDAKTNDKSFIYASLSFGLLIFTKYVFIYLLPLIILWLIYDKQKTWTKKMKNIITFGIIPAIFFLTWTFRNMILHGLSLEGTMGGYNTLIENPSFFEIYPNTIPSKLQSIITCLEPNTMMIYFLLFFIGLIILYIQQKEIPYFNKLLLFNFIIFFCIPAMTYDRLYLNWRYLSTMTPVYLLYGLIPIINNLRLQKHQDK